MSQLAFFLARITPSIDLRWIPSDSIQLTGNKAAHQSADFDPEISGLGVEIGSKIKNFSKFFSPVFWVINAQKSTFQKGEKALINKGFLRFRQ
jgi:hypothetical protein